MPPGTSKRKAQKQISYQEVDSDYDMDSEEEEKLVKMKGKGGVGDELEDKKKVGDTYGTTPHAKKQKTRKATKKKNNNKLTYDVHLLLDLPFDLFAETCTHLEGSDLLSLAMVNKSLRKILLSRHSRSIWIASRKRDGFPLPQGMSEIALCRFMNEDSCQVCGKTAYFKRDFFLRVRLCQDHRKTHLIAQNKLSSQWKNLHPSAVECVRFVDNGTRFNGKTLPRTYLVTDLAAVDESIKDLEEDDEIALAQNESTVLQSSTRSRRGKVSKCTVEVNSVSSFVAAKQAWVSVEQETSTELEEAADKLVRDRMAVERAARQAKRDQLDEEAAELERNHGWTAQEIAEHRYSSARDYNKPKMDVSQDPASWKSYRTSIQEELADRAARLAEQQAQNRREARLRPLYDQLQTTSPSSWYKIFPSFSKFTQLQNVKPLCGPDRDSLDDPALQTLIVRATSNIRQDLRDYFKSVEVQAFRLIVAANQGVHVSTISNDPRDYDNYNYDDEFRLRATSLFAEHDFSMGNGNYVFSIAPFPAISKNGNWQPDYRPLSNFISVRQVRAVRAMIDAAGLDENWTFISQMDDLGKGFCWLNHPSKTMRQTKYTWVRLLDLILRRGPSNAKVLAGKGVEISYHRPDSDEDDIDASDEERGANPSKQPSESGNDASDEEGGDASDEEDNEEGEDA